MDFGASNNEDLFRGYIDSMEGARHILKALRIERYTAPQILSAKDDKLSCNVMETSE